LFAFERPKTVTLLIRIRTLDDDGAYPVEAQLDPGGYFKGEMLLDREKLLMEEFDPEAYGKTLSDALFSGSIRDAFISAESRAAATLNGQLRVRLWIDNYTAELQQLSWERLFDDSAGRPLPLATSADTPFARYIGLELPDRRPLGERPLRLLVAISNPNNLPEGLAEIQVGQELVALSQALGELSRQGQMDVTQMPGRTRLAAEVRQQLQAVGFNIEDGDTTLSNILRLMQDNHVLHFLGNGQYQSDKGQGGQTALYLEKDGGNWQAVGDETFARRLGSLRPPPLLICLAAGQGNERAGQGIFTGLGPKLVQAGVPAVVAMRDPLEMDQARELTTEFYRRLLDHGEVDRALNEARNLLLSMQPADWSIPILYTSLRDGRLLEKAAVTTPKPVADQAEDDLPQDSSGVDSLIYFNGINGETGEYDFPPMSAKELADFVKGIAPAENLDELRFRQQSRSDNYL
jgi:hypothetical protein